VTLEGFGVDYFVVQMRNIFFFENWPEVVLWVQYEIAATLTKKYYDHVLPKFEPPPQAFVLSCNSFTILRRRKDILGKS